MSAIELTLLGVWGDKDQILSSSEVNGVDCCPNMIGHNKYKQATTGSRERSLAHLRQGFTERTRVQERLEPGRVEATNTYSVMLESLKVRAGYLFLQANKEPDLGPRRTWDIAHHL